MDPNRSNLTTAPMLRHRANRLRELADAEPAVIRRTRLRNAERWDCEADMLELLEGNVT